MLQETRLTGAGGSSWSRRSRGRTLSPALARHATRRRWRWRAGRTWPQIHPPETDNSHARLWYVSFVADKLYREILDVNSRHFTRRSFIFIHIGHATPNCRLTCVPGKEDSWYFSGTRQRQMSAMACVVRIKMKGRHVKNYRTCHRVKQRCMELLVCGSNDRLSSTEQHDPR